MRKGRDGENEKEIEWKTIMFIVATNVDASRPFEHGLTATLSARAKQKFNKLGFDLIVVSLVSSNSACNSCPVS